MTFVEAMLYPEVVKLIADILKEFDSERPVHKAFKPGIGPFGEPQIVRGLEKGSGVFS